MELRKRLEAELARAAEDAGLLFVCDLEGQDQVLGHQRDRQYLIPIHLNLERL